MGGFQFRFADSDETVMSVTDLFVSSTGNFHIITLDRRLSHRKQMVFVSTPRCGQGFLRGFSPLVLVLRPFCTPQACLESVQASGPSHLGFLNR